MIINRQYYKRIVTIHNEEKVPKGVLGFVEKFRKAHTNVNFNQTLQKNIADSFVEYSKETITDTYFDTIDIDQTLSLLQTPNAILTDCPP